MGLCEFYCRSLQQHPLATKALTAATMAGASDIACQSIEQEPALISRLLPRELFLTLSGKEDDEHPHDSLLITVPRTHATAAILANSSAAIHINWNRTLQVCIVGLCWAGPAQHTWYNVLERVVHIQHRLGGLVARVALDATVYTPFGCKSFV